MANQLHLQITRERDADELKRANRKRRKYVKPNYMVGGNLLNEHFTEVLLYYGEFF